jgi:sporulation protein YlmC with PRC-barrel domain
MAESTQFTIGADASCIDGPCGQVIRVVVNPVAEVVTHLVVEPAHREGLGRLVPLDLVEVDADSGEVKMRCTLEEFGKLEGAEETLFLPGGGMYPGYASSQVFALPYYGLGVGNISPPIVTDAIPAGEVAIRRGQQVHATDGGIGRVQGLVIDRTSHHVTHVLLQEGHLWGRKDVVIPISAVTGIEDGGINLTLTKQEVQDLPAVDVDDPTGTTESP